MCRKMVSYQLLENKPCTCYTGGGEKCLLKKAKLQNVFSSSDRKALEKMAVSR